jgi:putative membrane protein insertion efficiency factor
MSKIIILFLQALIRAYQYTLSPDHGIMRKPYGHCRFYPSCSEYAHQALGRHGAVRGAWLAGKRLLKCHPFHAPGIDLVPERN